MAALGGGLAISLNATVTLSRRAIAADMDAFRRDVKQAVAASIGAGSTARLAAVTNSTAYAGAVVLTINVAFPDYLAHADALSLVYNIKKAATPSALMSALLGDAFDAAGRWKVARVMCVVVLDGVDSTDACNFPRRTGSFWESLLGAAWTLWWWPCILAGSLLFVLGLCGCWLFVAAELWKHKTVVSTVIVDGSFKPFAENEVMCNSLALAARTALVQTLGHGLHNNMVEVVEVRAADPFLYPHCTEIVFLVRRPWALRRLVNFHESFQLIYQDRFTPPSAAHVVLGGGFLRLMSWASDSLTTTEARIANATGRFHSGKGSITRQQQLLQQLDCNGRQPVAEATEGCWTAAAAATAEVQQRLAATASESLTISRVVRSGASLSSRRRTSDSA